VTRQCYTREEAAAALGVSVDFFDEHVRPEIKVIREGRRVLIPASEIEKWIDRNASTALGLFCMEAAA
jgi:excisionase family DNA binding protein